MLLQPASLIGHLNWASDERREQKSSLTIMIDLARDSPDKWLRSRDERTAGHCRAHCAGSNWKLLKKRTRFKKLTTHENKRAKNKIRRLDDTAKLITLRSLLSLLLISIIISSSYVQPAMADSGNHQTASTSPGSSPFVQSPDRFPSATLGKFGLIAGLRFDVHNSSVSSSVAAFLGVPYAAPPTGPLRFMPPGAVRPAANQAHQQRRRCQLQLVAANHSSPALMPPGPSSRFFGQFGSECVRLADWLSSASPGPPSPPPPPSSQGRQAEDCLNLNIFVPYEPTEAGPISSAHPRKPRLTRRTLPVVETNHRNQNGRLYGTANQVADQLQEAHGATRRLNRGVNSSESNLIAGAVGGVAQPDPQDDKISESPCYLEPLRVSQLADNKEKRWQSFHHYKQSTQTNSKRRLPVIVVFHSATSADANSLAWHLSLAQHAQSIVITFNYRIGLLGYLPYTDPEDQTGAGESSAAGHHTHSISSRLNHALWDQIGLLFWIKQNVAAFQGDPANVTLLSGDNKAAVQIQVLTLSPLAKGLFKRVVLTHNHLAKPTQTPERDHLGHMFGLATRSRELRRRLVSEMGLIVKRLDEEEEQHQDNATKNEQVSFSGDRRVFEFLKVANLSQLARVELELTKLSVSRPGAATIKLNDLISEPSFDDKMLFPYFAQLVKMNQSLGHATYGDGEKSLSDTRGSGSFWSFLQDNIDRATLNTRPMESTKMEVDYCLYLHYLYKGIFNRATTENNMTFEELNQLDPYKLIPRLSEHQLMALAASTSVQQQSHSSSAIDNNTSSMIDSNNTMRWTRNRTANAIDFFHLRHAHLLQQLLVRKLEINAQAGNASNLVTLHQNIRRENPSTNSTITLDDHPADSKLGDSEKNKDEEEEEDDNPSDRQKQQLLQHEQSSARTKRSALDQLGILGQRFIELMGNYDLLISVSYDKGNGNETQERSSFSLVETLLRVNNNKQIDHQLLAYLHLASLHYISTIKISSIYLNDLCDISSQYSGGIEETRNVSTIETTRHDIRSSYVILSHNQPRPTSIEHATSGPILLMNEELKEFVQSGHLASINGQRRHPYDTLNYHLNIGLEDESVLANETNELTSIHLDLVPYLERMLALQNKDSYPADLVSCLGDLESVIAGANNHTQANYSMVLIRLNEESYCITNVANRLRNQLRSGAARELEPITRRYLSISGEQQQQQRHMLNTKSTIRQQQLALMNGLTTRNLVNHSEGLYLDQLTSADQINNDQQMDASTSSNGSHIYPYDLNEASKHGVSVKNANLTASGSLRGFFAKTYKDAVGQALGIVVGTGALIFLLNLIIVLIIALKSRRRIRSGTEHVQESSPDLINLADQQQLKALNGLLMANHRAVINGSLTQTASLDSGTNQTKQLSSSFKDQLPRSSLSSNSQRANRSIKFDLSGVEDQTRTAINGVGNQQQRGIMKQPILTTSDEDGDLSPSNQHLMPTGTCIHHSRESPYTFHGDGILSPQDMLDDSLDLNGFDLNEMVISDEYSSSQPQQQHDHQHLTNSAQVKSQECAHHQHQRQMQSLGSGSLTSPFASQSTPSISAASCGQQIYTINHNNNSQSHHMIIAKTGEAHQHQQQLFYPLAAVPMDSHTAAILNSPSTSNTLSSAPTPILLAGTNELLSPAVGQQMVNLIYPCDNLLMQQLQSKGANNATLGQSNQLLVKLSPDQQHYMLNSQQQLRR